MESDQQPEPKLTLDVHAELPPQRRHRQAISKHEQRRTEARIVFNKILASHYKDKGNTYSEVGSLFITWESSDLQLNHQGSEVNRLHNLFRTKLGHKTDTFQIPSEKSESALSKKVADFVHRFNDANNLIILYYAGHGFGKDEEEDQHLNIAARDTGDGVNGDPQAFFPDVVTLLHKTSADVLLIVDCCFAAKAFSNERLGRRKFELLASSMDWSPSPGRAGSFTTVLIKVINDLLQDKKHQDSFSTGTLYRKLYHHADLKRFKPLLFDQSQFDYGKIWLRPQMPSNNGAVPTNRSDVALDLKLHLKLTQRDPVGLAMNQLAMALQYLPHVDKIDFEELHAGDEDVALFLNVLGRATYVKRVIRILRERVNARRKEKLAQEATRPKFNVVRSDSFYKVVNKAEQSSTQDWSAGFAEFKNGTRRQIARGLSDQPWQQADTHIQTHIHSRSRELLIPGLVDISYILDFTGIWMSASRRFPSLLGLRTETSNVAKVLANSEPTIVDKSEKGSPKRDDLVLGGCNTGHLPQVQSHFSPHLFSPERLFWMTLLVIAIWSGMK